MNKWRELEQRLSGVFALARVAADGHDVKFVKRLCGERLVIEVYVDGWVKGEWSKSENGQPVHPEARFWRPARSRVWPLKQHANLKRVFGKKKADQMTASRVICFLPTWNSPRTLVRHLKKHFPDLELKDYDGEAHSA